jgi:putative Mg2+ transporter-C (MgtC) family protein
MFGAIFLGGVIGLERQRQQRMMALRTNGLVAVGSAMFITMGLRGSRRYRHFLGAGRG